MEKKKGSTEPQGGQEGEGCNMEMLEEPPLRLDRQAERRINDMVAA